MALCDVLIHPQLANLIISGYSSVAMGKRQQNTLKVLLPDPVLNIYYAAVIVIDA